MDLRSDFESITRHHLHVLITPSALLLEWIRYLVRPKWYRSWGSWEGKKQFITKMFCSWWHIRVWDIAAILHSRENGDIWNITSVAYKQETMPMKNTICILVECNFYRDSLCMQICISKSACKSHLTARSYILISPPIQQIIGLLKIISNVVPLGATFNNTWSARCQIYHIPSCNNQHTK